MTATPLLEAPANLLDLTANNLGYSWFASAVF